MGQRAKRIESLFYTIPEVVRPVALWRDSSNMIPPGRVREIVRGPALSEEPAASLQIRPRWRISTSTFIMHALAWEQRFRILSQCACAQTRSTLP